MVSVGPIPYPLLALARTLGASGLIALHELSRLPPVKRVVRKVFTDTLTLQDIDEKYGHATDLEVERKYTPSPILQSALAVISGIELVVWLATFGDELALAINESYDRRPVVLAGAMAWVWLILFIRAAVRPPVTPPWSSLCIYIVLLVTSVVTLLNAAFARYTQGKLPVWATPASFALESCNAVACLLLALLAGQLRFNSPRTLARAPVVALDDVVTLWQWITFKWMTPFIKEYATKEMQPEDLPPMSPTMRASILFDQFREVMASSLLWKLFKLNHFDFLVDLSLTYLAVMCNYLSPFFLNRILQAIKTASDGSAFSRDALAKAYVYALLTFLASVTKTLCDLIHLWHSRRATARIKSQLMVAIYHKALLRKDASGVITKEGEGEDDGKKSASEGKVVNLMAGDANRIAGVASMLFFVYSNPLELTIASIFLYNLLGWSAFAGILVLVVAIPLNTMLSKRSFRIQKALLKARDKRVSVMSEMINAISFIKFFAWTEEWKERAVNARNQELREMIRGILNGLLFSLVWLLIPILVTLCSFFSYIVIAKKELDVATAFTSIALFAMLRTPLATLPGFIVYIIQTHVSIKRVDDFLGEDEVPDWVSSFKRHEVPSTKSPEANRVGFDHATLRWNAGSKSESEEAKKDAEPAPASTTPAVVVSPVTEEGNNVPEEEPERIFELSDINVDFPVGKLSVVSGPTGAGKTAILIGLLGEMDLISGKTFLPKYSTQVDPETGLRNSVAYCAQTPWLQQKSIKDNILYGEELDEERYEAVVDACALRTDFNILEDGDQTEIGAKGVSLSGGQKARVALARAVYSYTKHVLLDDPLAAVDSHTAKHLVDNCLKSPLLQGRTVILVSHHLDLLTSVADYIVRILDGRVDCQGSPKELQADGQLDGIIAVEEAIAAKTEPVEAEVVVETTVDDSTEKKEKKKGPARKLVKDEERVVGNVKWPTYKLYIQAATYITWALWFVIIVFVELGGVSEKLWLKVWGQAYETNVTTVVTLASPTVMGYMDRPPVDILHHFPANNVSMPGLVVQSAGDILPELPPAKNAPGFYLAVYAFITLGTAFLAMAAQGVSSWGAYRASVNLHNRLLNTVTHSTIRFFNTTPLGRIINRFSKDIELIDGQLSRSLTVVIMQVANLITAVALVAGVIPGFLLPAAAISAVYYHYSLLYLRTGRSLRRLEATSKSPIFSGFAELLDGVVTVRAFSGERQAFNTMCEQVDQSNSAYYYYWMSNRWLLVRFDFLGAISVFTTILLCLSGAVDNGLAGVAILSAQEFVSACYWMSRFWGEMEMNLNAVERVEEYLHVPQEPPAEIAGHRPPAYWPSHTTTDAFISAQDLEIKYAPELPTVFKGSFDIKAGEKIGLIGRTGSGKSTVAMMMLRFTDPASGKLLIDGIDITSIGVDDLRSRITYIPQDAVLFSGTVRENLDPFKQYSDEELMDALRRVNLISGTATGAPTPAMSRQPSHIRVASLAQEAVAETESIQTGSGSAASGAVKIKLTTEVSAGGANFSQGQRQLMAMARALLRRSNLIIMDEATASVDFATDEAIQQAIRTEFKNSTLITIAHRLSSVIDYDRLLVLDAGKVAEFDTPINLLRRESLFKNLCQKSGKYSELFRAAERKEQGAAGYDVAADWNSDQSTTAGEQ